MEYYYYHYQQQMVTSLPDMTCPSDTHHAKEKSTITVHIIVYRLECAVMTSSLSYQICLPASVQVPLLDKPTPNWAKLSHAEPSWAKLRQVEPSWAERSQS